MTDGNVSPGSLFLPSELRGAGARSLWPGWADRARFRPEGSCSLGCPPGAHVRAGAHGTGWGRRGDEAGLSSVLFPGASPPCCSRSRAPARGTAKGPRSRRTARTEAEPQVGGPRVGGAPRARPFLPRPATRASTRAPSASGGCRASASPGVTAVAGGAGARPLHVHWRDHKALEPHPVRFYQTVCSSVNARN